MIKKARISKGIIMTLVATAALSTGCQQTAKNPTTQAAVPDASTTTVSETKAPETVGIVNEVLWGQQFGTLYEDLAISIAVDKEGNSCVAGYTLGDVAGSNKGDKDVLVAKFDTTGKQLWSLQTGTDGSENANYIVLNAAGDAYVTGNTTGKFASDSDEGRIFIQKISKSGKLLWTKQYGGSERATSNVILIDAKENLYISGSTNGKLGEKSFGNNDAYLSKLDSEGKVIWTCQWGTDGNEEIKGIDLDESGNIFAVGDTSGNIDGSNIGIVDVFVSQISPEGKVVFSKQFGTAVADTSTQVLASSDKNIYLTGWTSGDFADKNLGSDDAILMKLSSTGEMLWKKQFGTPLWDGIHGIVQSKDDPAAIIVGGCQNYGECQAFLRKFDADGNEVWKKEQIPAFSTCGRGIAIDDQGFIYQTGGTHGQLYGDKVFEGVASDIFIYKVSEK